MSDPKPLPTDPSWRVIELTLRELLRTQHPTTVVICKVRLPDGSWTYTVRSTKD